MDAPAGTRPDPTYDYTALSRSRAGAAADRSTEEIPEYRRATFGERWIDIEGTAAISETISSPSSCRDVVRDGCTVLSGVLDPDPYTGTRIEFEHDRIAAPGAPGSSGVQIDHIVSLSAAHAGGAWAWTEQQRHSVLPTRSTTSIAVDGNTNAAKNDHGPAPVAAIERRLRVHLRRPLHGDRRHLAPRGRRADRGALVDTLSTCAAQQASDESGSMS
ncbi:HNH endonuclease [Microbacterium sp. NRRL B-14842]|uniref:HNH endonuclease family protein n=1 Tax=Microbacterium sp. NRRL B-14842 TaxID=3162881 RepID=UPI003D285FFB